MVLEVRRSYPRRAGRVMRETRESRESPWRHAVPRCFAVGAGHATELSDAEDCKNYGVSHASELELSAWEPGFRPVNHGL